MTVFITSSPFVDGADRAILCNANGFVDRLREALPTIFLGVIIAGGIITAVTIGVVRLF